MHHQTHLAPPLLETGCWVLPGNGGELLLQCLIVGELDGLSSASGFDHVTLKEKCEGQNCPLKEDIFILVYSEDARGENLD